MCSLQHTSLLALPLTRAPLLAAASATATTRQRRGSSPTPTVACKRCRFDDPPLRPSRAGGRESCLPLHGPLRLLDEAHPFGPRHALSPPPPWPSKRPHGCKGLDGGGPPAGRLGGRGRLRLRLVGDEILVVEVAVPANQPRLPVLPQLPQHHLAVVRSAIMARRLAPHRLDRRRPCWGGWGGLRPAVLHRRPHHRGGWLRGGGHRATFAETWRPRVAATLPMDCWNVQPLRHIRL